jgi:Methyltransferase domain
MGAHRLGHSPADGDPADGACLRGHHGVAVAPPASSPSSVSITTGPWSCAATPSSMSPSSTSRSATPSGPEHSWRPGLADVERLVVPRQLLRSLRQDEEEAERSARALLGVLARQLSRDDLDGVHVLDIGCGVKLTQALINHGLPIGSYTGIDASAPVIDFLRSSVDDPRFAFHHVDFHNARYNPTGVQMTPDTVLPVERADFDLICGLSLVTHLAPDDTKSILAITARYAHERTQLVSRPSSTSTPRGATGWSTATRRRWAATSAWASRTRTTSPTTCYGWRSTASPTCASSSCGHRGNSSRSPTPRRARSTC